MAEPLKPNETRRIDFGKVDPPADKSLRDIQGPLQIRLRDLATNNVLDTKQIPVRIATPREYVAVTDISFDPGVGGNNRLTVKVQAKRDIPDPGCEVKLVLSPDRIPGYTPPPKEENATVVLTKKGEDKEEKARPYIEAAAREGKDRVVLIGIAQEKASVWRSWVRKGHENRAHPHMEWGRQMAFINHFYFYIWDSDWGGTFWKTNAYAPYPVWLWLNGHEWTKRQLEKAGIGYEALDNGFGSCNDPEKLQKVCDRLGPGAVKNFFWRWLDRLPSPFTPADMRAGYVYDLAFRQFEVSDTRVFERPQAGRMWFEA